METTRNSENTRRAAILQEKRIAAPHCYNTSLTKSKWRRVLAVVWVYSPAHRNCLFYERAGFSKTDRATARGVIAWERRCADAEINGIILLYGRRLRTSFRRSSLFFFALTQFYPPTLSRYPVCRTKSTSFPSDNIPTDHSGDEGCMK